MQFSARPPRDHSQAPVAHSLGNFSPGNTIAADSATEFSRDKRRCNDTACLRTLPQRVPLKRQCIAQNTSPASTVGTTLPGNFSKTMPHRWNDNVTELSGQHIPLERHCLGNSSETATTPPLALTLSHCCNRALPIRHNHSQQPIATTKQDVCSDYHTPNSGLEHRISPHLHCS